MAQAIRPRVIFGALSSPEDGAIPPYIFRSGMMVSGGIFDVVPFHVAILCIVQLSSVIGESVAAANLRGPTVAMGLTTAKIDGSRGNSHLLLACGAFCVK
jgi:hypothetical protein